MWAGGGWVSLISSSGVELLSWAPSAELTEAAGLDGPAVGGPADDRDAHSKWRANLTDQLRNGEISFAEYKQRTVMLDPVIPKGLGKPKQPPALLDAFDQAINSFDLPQVTHDDQASSRQAVRTKTKEHLVQDLREGKIAFETYKVQMKQAESMNTESTIVVVVRNVIGRAEELAMSAGNLVGELKQAVHSRMGMQVERQRLMLGECELSDDSKTLRQYGVCDQSVVMLGSQMAAP